MREREYWALRMRETGALIGETWTEFAQFVGRVRGADPAAVIRPEELAAIGRAKAGGRKHAILSNELDLFYGKDFRWKLPFLDEFNVFLDATYTGILKPDARACAAVTEALGSAPEACVFVDDQPGNVSGADAAGGMHAVACDVQAPASSFARALAALGLDDEDQASPTPA